jgi:hypothetical protein
MLFSNEILISATESSIQELYSKILPTTIESDIRNMHEYYSNKERFVNILLDNSYNLSFEFAYIESCSIESDGRLKIVAYSWMNDLIDWVRNISNKIKDRDDSIKYEITILKGVKFKSYNVEVIPDIKIESKEKK